MKRRIIIFGVVLAGIAAITVTAFAQTGELDLSWFTIDSGGGTSTGGDFELDGSIGQPDASSELTGGDFALQPGFMSGITTPIEVVDRGDCNGDNDVSAADITATVLEIFDGDGDVPGDAPGGTFAGTEGCDSNDDGAISAADITCVVLLIFNQQCGGTAINQIGDTPSFYTQNFAYETQEPSYMTSS